MPYLMIRTNVTIDNTQADDMVRQASQTTAQLLGKPESYVMVSLDPGTRMRFGGSDQPCAYLELYSLGLPQDRTTDLSSGLSDLIHRTLNVPPERTYIRFADSERHMWGFKGGTF